MLTHTLPRCVPMHSPGPTHRPRFDGGFVFHTMMMSSALNTVWFEVEHVQSPRCYHGWTPQHELSWRPRESDGTPHNLHPSLQDHRQDQARRRRHSSSPREDGLQSRTLAGEETSLNGRTVDTWQHLIPQPSAEAPQNCSESASNERARKSFCRCHRVVLSGHFAMALSRQLCEVGCCLHS